MKKPFVCLIASILVPSLITSCATSPTGRKQFMAVPDSEMNSLGAQSFEEMKTQVPIDRDPATNAYVKCVADAIVAAAAPQTQGMDIASWDVVVFQDKSANAFALPGGKIGVHTGILPVAKTPAQLAAVLGHEVG